MDEVLEKLGSLAGPGKDESRKTNFDALYKNWGRLGNQEERRREILEIQKQSRNDNIDQSRGILDLICSVEEEREERSYKTGYRPSIYVAGFNRVSHSYNNVLMMSEWMLEKPIDFETEWLVVPCPKGVRMLVVANRGTTKCFTKYGQYRFQHRTALPGGHSFEGSNKNACSVLDCFYFEKFSTMYVVDILVWKDQPMTDGETDFRHYWLQSQLAELDDLRKISNKNQLLFTILPKVSCETKSFNDFMQRYPAFGANMPELDGLLFYHRRARYTSGQTPLVGWLFPYMVPEVLGRDVTVHQLYLAGMPPDYTNQAEFIQKFEEKYAKKSRPRLYSNSSIMSVTDKIEDGSNTTDDMDTAVSATLAEPAGISADAEDMEEENLLKDAMKAHIELIE